MICPVYPGRMSALSTRLTRGARAATASTARLTTSIASSHVRASIVVNMEVVSHGSPDSRTTRTASATTSPTLSVPPPEGATLNATSMVASVPQPRRPARPPCRVRAPIDPARAAHAAAHVGRRTRGGRHC